MAESLRADLMAHIDGKLDPAIATLTTAGDTLGTLDELIASRLVDLMPQAIQDYSAKVLQDANDASDRAAAAEQESAAERDEREAEEAKARAKQHEREAKAARKAEQERIETAALDYLAAAELREGPPAPFVPGAAYVIRVQDGESFVPHVDPIRVSGERDIELDGDGLLLTKRILLAPNGPPATASHVWLLGDGFARSVEVGAVRFGGGTEVAFPSGHLRF